MSAAARDRTVQVLWIVGGICVALFAIAFAAAPKSCEGGLEFYFWSGIAALIALFAVPVALRADLSALRRAAYGAAFSVVGGATWCLGLFVANIRFICRLF
jgi:hypothetical protein